METIFETIIRRLCARVLYTQNDECTVQCATLDYNHLTNSVDHDRMKASEIKAMCSGQTIENAESSFGRDPPRSLDVYIQVLRTVCGIISLLSFLFEFHEIWKS